MKGTIGDAILNCELHEGDIVKVLLGTHMKSITGVIVEFVGDGVDVMTTEGLMYFASYRWLDEHLRASR